MSDARGTKGDVGALRDSGALRDDRAFRRAKRGGAVIVFALALAPYQCGKSPDRALREETPGEALYGLAQRMKAQGDDAGYRTTLRYLVERYPSSRYAVAARTDLGDAAPVDLATSATDAGAP